MLSQLAKRSIRGLFSGLSKAAVCFLMISTLSLSVEKFLKQLCMLSPPAKEYNGGISESAHFFRMFDYFSLGKSVKIGRNSTSLEM